jgi:hypothetical protein
MASTAVSAHPTSVRGKPGPFLVIDGIGAPEVVRLYLAMVGTGSDTHLFVIALDVPNESELTSSTQVVAPIIASIRLPAVIGSR